jgi:hypothetical protein
MLTNIITNKVSINNTNIEKEQFKEYISLILEVTGKFLANTVIKSFVCFKYLANRILTNFSKFLNNFFLFDKATDIF